MPDVHSVDRDSFRNAYSSFHHHRLPLSSSDGLEATQDLSNSNSNTNKPTTVVPSTQQLSPSSHHKNEKDEMESTKETGTTENRKDEKPANDDEVGTTQDIDLSSMNENERRRLKVKEVCNNNEIKVYISAMQYS